MRVLLDTHALLWMMRSSPELSAASRAILGDDSNQLVLSIGSLWEVAVKHALGKINVGASFDEFAQVVLKIDNITIQPVSIPHLSAVATLPAHHRDPFDRLLIAQALVENLPILSRDTALDAYGIRRIW